MNYLDVYFSRLNHFGDNPQDRIQNSGILAFEKWLAKSPFTVKNLSSESNIYFSGIIQTSKDKEEKKLMYLYVANDIPLVVGDIINWVQDNGDLEKWILLQEIHKVHGTYHTFSMIKCNYELKWINEKGRLIKSWAYVCSSTDDKIKGNFRTWHSLITPQPNKYAEIIMPRKQVNRGTNFIIEDEGWQMVESDFTSVKGIIYMSLTENKVNYSYNEERKEAYGYDDIEVEVADTDKLAFPTLKPIYVVGEYLEPNFNENTFNEWEIELKPAETTSVVEQVDGYWRAVEPGKITMNMRLKGRASVVKTYEVLIEEDTSEHSAYISGPDTIKLGRQQEYCLMNEKDEHIDIEIDENNLFVFSIEYIPSESDKKNQIVPSIPDYIYNNDQKPLATRCKIIANNKNIIGPFILHATYNNKEYTKTINVVPLW